MRERDILTERQIDREKIKRERETDKDSERERETERERESGGEKMIKSRYYQKRQHMLLLSVCLQQEHCGVVNYLNNYSSFSCLKDKKYIAL